MKTLLVTGGAGLVGQAIQTLSPKYNNYYFVFVRSRDFDLRSMEETRKMFRKYQPKIVIHLAACVGGLFKNMNHKVDMLEDNTLINFNVVKCAHEFNVERLLACLSTCIFPDKTTYPINEDMLHDGPPHTSNDAYAYAKRMLETHCAAYRENYGRDFKCVIPTNIYGPHDNYHLEDAHVIPALIHKCYLAKQNNDTFVVRGSGSPLRQFIYSEDLAELMLYFIHADFRGGNLILSVPEDQEVSIADVARQIARCFQYEDKLVFDETYADGQFKKTADNSRLREMLDFQFMSFEQGIQKSVDWFVENYDHARK